MKRTNDEVKQRILQSGTASKYGVGEETLRRIEETSAYIGTGTSRGIAELAGQKVSHYDIEDIERKVTFEYAKNNGLWIESIYSLGSPLTGGGNENTLVLSFENTTLYKSNNLFNSNNSIVQLLGQTVAHNLNFPDTKYELAGFTGFSNGLKRAPYIEVVLKQDYIPNSTQASPNEIQKFMTSLGFSKISEISYQNEFYIVSDLFPRNVLKTANGGIVVIDNIITSRN
ncbi:hypothetical protein [Dyadobacter sp. CY312]|uniref:putative polyvalent protein kinase domain-containing protein n=1 Tax=Dyadobacter sp. CY312 TaxID=2907303 RepID=UPI001F3F227E|nr:hypothetical protein [Dyadobacter sp. CY312]MCE7041046.1 hypothetical protein [Dyadobacter sp. CY312]